MTDEMYSAEDKAAFMRVGEFLNWFSQLELQMDEAIIRILGIEVSAGRLLLSYVPCRNKCEFLKKLSNLRELGLGNQEREDAKKITSWVQSLHDERNVLAHSFFRADAGGVRFLKAEKTLGPDMSRHYSDERFIEFRNEMADLWGRLAQVSARIESKVSERKQQIAEAMLESRFEEMLAPFTKPH